MTFGHRLACNDANLLISMSSTFFSNSCHFLKNPFFADTAQRGDRRHRARPMMAFRHVTPPMEGGRARVDQGCGDVYGATVAKLFSTVPPPRCRGTVQGRLKPSGVEPRLNGYDILGIDEICCGAVILADRFGELGSAITTGNLSRAVG
jgi:hypothetical protein